VGHPPYTDTVMGSWQFGYDQLNRLTTAVNTAAAVPTASTPALPSPTWAQYFCWAYDNFGNRLAQSNSNAAFTAASGSCSTSGTLYQNLWASYNTQNQMTGTNAPGYALTPPPPLYDAAGDVVNDGNRQYLYDAEGRLCAEGNVGYGGVGYLYDAAGNRVAKGTINWNGTCDVTTNGFTQTESYVVGPSGEQLTEVAGSFDGGGYTWEHTNVYAGGKLIATYSPDGELSFHIDDPLGTRRAQANSSGMLDAVYQSLPFGDGYSWNSTLGYDPTENHFTGKERDTESGNDYMFARYYNSATGRFLSPDWSAKEEPVPYAKLDNPQSLNLYAYVRNNPLAKADPDGHAPPDPAPDPTANQTPDPNANQPASVKKTKKLDPSNQECVELAKKINNIADDIIKRDKEIQTNPLNLPLVAPPGSKPRESVEGHQQLNKELIDTLGQRLDTYNDKCGGGPPGSPVTASAPQASISPTAVKATAGMIIGIGIIVTLPESAPLIPVVAP